jgi:hypothetical protein
MRLGELVKIRIIHSRIVEHESKAFGGTRRGWIVHVPKGDAIRILSREGIVREGASGGGFP